MTKKQSNSSTENCSNSSTPNHNDFISLGAYSKVIGKYIDSLNEQLKDLNDIERKGIVEGLSASLKDAFDQTSSETSERIINRFEIIIGDAFDDFKENILIEKRFKHGIPEGKEIWDYLSFDVSLGAHIALNAYQDLYRMNVYHLSPVNSGPDNHKYAGFLAKWVAIARPIQLKFEDIKVDNNFLLMINAFFATWVFLSQLNNAELPIRHKALEALNYQFHFRSMKGEELSLLAYFIEESTMKRPSDTEL